MSLLRWYQKYWRKKIADEELLLRRHAFHYREMHANGLGLIRDARRALRPLLANISAPMLTIHSRNDPVGNYRAIRVLERTRSAQQHTRIFSQGPHNLFFSETRHELYREISSFFATTPAEPEAVRPRVAAIVPAYNEAANIGRVLQVLNATPELDEIIAVDDGSSDQTSAEVRKFPRVTLLRNDPNQGKAQSMQRGVSATTADILFFCDADLHGLTPQSVAQIIRPVAQGHFDMFIGIRNNRMQKAVQLFAVNSGERAVSRNLWEKLPAQFKHRYRIEAGLNHIARRWGRGYGWRQFDYYQTLKEQKYGFVRGTALRWWMNLDVGYAYLLAILGRFFSDGPHTPA